MFGNHRGTESWNLSSSITASRRGHTLCQTSAHGQMTLFAQH
ncbi:hypothetical protein GPB2148_1122 [marine gamma proteobacterium HTCC2148]|nr:hypothetical protein GPB2148_1122 [marine gamma proteobacterium HTCC2148]